MVIDRRLSNDMRKIGIIASSVQVPIISTGPILDTYSGATHAYSLRKLSSSYTGPAIQIQRASDSATLDVGFVGEDLDIAAIESFCTGTVGYVMIIYDQVGSDDVPSIYFSATIYDGGLITANGKVAVQLNTDDFKNYTVEISDYIGSSQCYWVGVLDISLGGDGTLIAIDDFGTNYSTLATFGGGGGLSLRNFTYYSYSFTTGSDNGSFIIEGVYSSPTSISYYIDGALGPEDINSVGTYAPSGSTVLQLSAASEYFKECIVWNTDQSSNRAGIYSNVAAYW